ncbi:hypothetical protein LAC81_30110 [Ensifer adhaerens]|uniref:hypothetical protein n=1 Tax=Ensifer adhaerens TaxID=106592 RepID=UPI001CBF0E75|nr:hypothetical protein [Ensifer adhaerens]MBZ7924994.1 hypothetical protein [Ensifer adhaerens]UAX95800.1 hypothetical protein LAC78_33720 [Ensifer adhaerens]UAY04859.1 hypothetical protein LAC80_26590 [Ensifer adhaerens]UAY10291.1 hypothetical protein LAC81_30110 [Ensifer adhaerens]
MLDNLAVDPSILDAAFCGASANVFYPRATVFCRGGSAFRSQLARDLGCLLDVDDNVAAWSCLRFGFALERGPHVSDFVVHREDGARQAMDAVEGEGNPAVTAAAARLGIDHRFIPRSEIERGFRLQNAKDILRYARYRTPLNDRVRVLAALEENGTITVSEAFSLFREVQPMTGISWLVLNRFIRVDLDEAILGPETAIRRFHR